MPRRNATKLVLAVLAVLAGTGRVAPGAESRPSLQELEKQIVAAPDDLELRKRALKAYFLERSPEERAARARHALWVIANAPGDDFAGTPFAGFHWSLDPEPYQQAKSLWLSVVEKKGTTDPDVLYNAARFFVNNDDTLAAEFYKRGMALEPNDPRWKESLAHLLMLGTESDPSKEKGAGALPLLEAALAEAEGELGRSYLLPDVAEAALQAGEDTKARAYAEELLALSERAPRDWNQGNAIHDGNRILGHVALRAGDVEAAAAYLLKAGATPGSPQLNSFGPSLTLANDLLKKGQRDAVIRYLEMCGTFWKGPDAALKGWIAEIRAGGTPELNRFKALRSGPEASGR